ncbi:transposase [Mycobacterium tuberculosis]|uniref:transposase n=1 Tax=Mycobacterium tuberculosis TaxID=1773 RepID=UPI0004ACB120|nr:transposase [Mycobacterium tuberculosis]
MAIDPAAAYASAIRTPGLLPNAKLVVDHFHVTTLANDALTAVRRRVTWAFHDRRGRKIDPQCIRVRGRAHCWRRPRRGMGWLRSWGRRRCRLGR